MSDGHSRRSSTIPFAAQSPIPSAPPLPAPRPLQRARDAANRFFGYHSRPTSPQEADRLINSGGKTRFATLSPTQDATATHKTGLEINTIAINERGTHALVGGKEIFKTIRVEDGICAEDLNLRSAIRSTPTQASGKRRQIYSIDIADVAWAKGDCGDYVAAATSSGKIILYDLGHAGLQAAQLHEHFRQVHKVTFNPHRGNLLLSGSQDGTVRLWDVRDVRQAGTLQSKRKYSGQSDGVRDVKWSPTEGVDFAFGTDSGWIQRWDMRNLKTAKVKIPAHGTTCNTIDWHPDGKHIASASSDKTVRVWDFSTNRRQKAVWEIKTPYPVLNARWRPTCESSMPNGNGAKQCTQLCTSYDSAHPVLHVWDFRRPALPFREISPYLTAPTDLLWHSQDLLWTVGREGVFLQTDIQHAGKVIDKRNLQAFAISPQGEINFVNQKRRKQPRIPRRRDPPSLTSKSTSLSQSPEHSFLRRSWTDDSLDHSFLSILPAKRDRRSHNNRRTHSGSIDTSHEHIPIMTLKLDDILLHCKFFKPHQLSGNGHLPGDKDARIFIFLAQNYILDASTIATDADFFEKFLEILHHNARCCEAAGLYRLAQTWRILSFSAMARYAGDGSNRYARSIFRSLGEEEPVTLVSMVTELVQHYAHIGDSQTAAHIGMLFGPLLPRALQPSDTEREEMGRAYVRSFTGAGYIEGQVEALTDGHGWYLGGVQPQQAEAMLLSYHDQLVSRKLLDQATTLRKLCHPRYPAVYGQAMKNDGIYVKCSTCGKNITTGTKKLTCDSCEVKQGACPVCASNKSPEGRGAACDTTVSHVRTTCSRCNHSAHALCLGVWFAEGDDGCPTEGCTCKCVKGN